MLVFESAGVDLSKPLLTTCGSGITAAIVTLAAHMLNVQAPLYDVRGFFPSIASIA